MSDGGGFDGYAAGPSPSPSPTWTPGPAEDLEDAAPRHARQLARWVRPGAAVPWRGLEVAAYGRHPEVQDALDPRRRWRRRADAWPLLVLQALTVLTVFGGVLAALVLGSDAAYGAPSSATADVVAGAGATLAAGALLLRLGSWTATRAAGRQPHTIDLAVAAVALLVVHGLVVLGWLVGTGRWTAVVVVPVAAGGALAVATLVAVVVARVPATGGPAATAAPADPRVVAARLPERARRRVLRDLSAALDELERRGLAGAATIERARAAEPGDLADAATGRRRPRERS